MLLVVGGVFLLVVRGLSLVVVRLSFRCAVCHLCCVLPGACCVVRVVCVLRSLVASVWSLLFFLLLDCRLQLIVCCVLPGAVVNIVVRCLLFVVWCDYCLLRLLFAVCCLVCAGARCVLCVAYCFVC